MIKKRKRIVNNLGYVLYWYPDHPRADHYGAYAGYVYEHILVAERFLGRALRKREEVHHLDFNRANNSPRNLLVLFAAQHTKLHTWLRRQGLEPKLVQFSYSDNEHQNFLKQCSRCAYCKWPMNKSKGTCSLLCLEKQRKKADLQYEEILGKLLSKKVSWVRIGKKLGMSDNGARKIAKRLGMIT